MIQGSLRRLSTRLPRSKHKVAKLMFLFLSGQSAWTLPASPRGLECRVAHEIPSGMSSARALGPRGQKFLGTPRSGTASGDGFSCMGYLFERAHSLIQASCMHITGYNAHHPDCTWSIGIFIHTYLFSCKLCGSRAGFKWDFERHRSGRLQCSFQHARTSMLRCLICRFDKLHHTVIVCIQADFKLWVEILAVRPSSCCVPSLLLWVRSSSRSTSRTTMWWASASNSWAYFSGLSELWVKEILNLNKVVGAATLDILRNNHWCRH